MTRIYGSLTNRMMENVKPVQPTKGMGATVLMYSDRHAATVVEILSAKRIVIQEDVAVRTDKNGMSENQEYEYTPNPAADRRTVTLRKDGRWRVSKSQTVILLGERDSYHDYSF
jgi:hypothetical protein